jgi:hypothetical protein
MAIDIKQYAEELFKTAGVSDDTVKQAVTNFLSNDVVAKRLGDDILRQQDYSRNMDSLTAEKQKAADYYATLVTWKEQQDAAVATHQPVVAAVQPDFTAFEKKFNDRIAQQEGQFVNLLEIGMNLASRHAVEFKEALDTTAVKDIAVKNNLPLAQAYEQYVGPRREASKAEAYKAELLKAREEGARDFASTHKIPVDTQPREYHTLLDQDRKKQVGVEDYKPGSGELTPAMNRTLEGNFADAWNSATARTSGT